MRRLLPLLGLCCLPSLLPAQISAPLDSAIIAGMKWRNIGPANMMGRVSDVEGLPSPSRTFYVAAAAGGVWKTTNAGTTFKLVFGFERVVATGDLAIAPSDSNVLYLGTGEEDSRNSISPGGGIYKSTDGGETWKFLGLAATQAVGRIVVHPTDPNTAWVAALGAIWNSNPERGIYKTTDGGETWRKVKFISDKAGFVDLTMDPRNPRVLWATSWERQRGPYFLKSGGPGSGIWKSTDGGETWTAVRGGGLPESTLGRIGLAIAPSNPDVMYALVEADTLANPKPMKDSAAQTRPSGLYRSADGGKTWEKRASQNVRPFYYSQVRVDPRDADRVYWSSTPVNFSEDGGATVRTATQGIHVDHHAMWIDPNDHNYFVVGNDGGIGVTFDGGGNYFYPNTFPIGQPYNTSFDFAVPYNVCGGFQDNGSWCGPSRRRQGAISNEHWFNVSGGDGFGTQQDPTDPNIIYSTSQGGNMGRFDYRTGDRVGLEKPSWRPSYQAMMDSIDVVRADTTKAMSAANRKLVAELRQQATRDSAALVLRWNWNSPFFLSPHNSNTMYMGANRVMKSTRRGDDMYPISPDLTGQDTLKIRISTRTTGGITPDATGAETYATIVSLNESPMRPGLLYAGTDDGKVWITRNDGGTWEDLTGRFPGVPPLTYVSRIEPSHHDSARVYLTFDGHRGGDFTPYVYLSNDFGKTWRSISANLPTGAPDFAHVIREDPRNPNLLFVGTDVGAYVSLDRGGSWQRFMTGLPTVPVHDLQIHPRDREMIAATHGRSFWIVDIAPLQDLTPEVLAAQVHVFEPKTAYQLVQRPDGYMGGGAELGHMTFRSNTPPHAAEIVYRVAPGAPSGRARIVITDIKGDTVRSMTGLGSPGLHRVYWNFEGPPPTIDRSSPAAKRDSARIAARIGRVVDSMVKAGGDQKVLDSLQTAILSGNIGGFGGGGGGGGGIQTPGIPTFVSRPGEGGPVTAGRGGGGGSGGSPMFSLIQALGGFRALGDILPSGRGFGGGQLLVDPGTYLLTVTVAGQTTTHSLKVAKVKGTGGLDTGELMP